MSKAKERIMSYRKINIDYIVDVVDIIAGADGLTDFEIRVGE